MPTRRMQPDGVCSCCGKVGPTFADVRQCEDREFVSLGPDEWHTPPLCDACQDAQSRWDAWQYELAHPGAGYPYWQGPPKTPPVRR